MSTFNEDGSPIAGPSNSWSSSISALLAGTIKAAPTSEQRQAPLPPVASSCRTSLEARDGAAFLSDKGKGKAVHRSSSPKASTSQLSKPSHKPTSVLGGRPPHPPPNPADSSSTPHPHISSTSTPPAGSPLPKPPPSERVPQKPPRTRNLSHTPSVETVDFSQKRRLRPCDDLLFGVDPPPPQPKRAPAPTPMVTAAVSKQHAHLFHKSKGSWKEPHYPKTIKHTPRNLPPAPFKRELQPREDSIAALNRRHQPPSLSTSRSAAAESKVALRVDTGEASKAKKAPLHPSPSNRRTRQTTPPLRPHSPVASTSTSPHDNPSSSSPASSPRVAPESAYHRDSFRPLRRSGGEGWSSGSEYEEEEIIVASVTKGQSKGKGQKHAKAKDNGKGKQRAMDVDEDEDHDVGGKGKKRAASREGTGAERSQTGKKSRRKTEAESWLELDCEEGIRGIQVPSDWSPRQKPIRDHEAPTTCTLEVTVERVLTFSANESASVKHIDCMLSLKITDLSLPSTPTTLREVFGTARLVPLSLPSSSNLSITSSYPSMAPTPTSTRSLTLPNVPLAALKTQQLQLEVSMPCDSGWNYSATHTLASECPSSEALPLRVKEMKETEAWFVVRVSVLPDEQPRQISTAMERLAEDLEALRVQHDHQEACWIPNAVTVRPATVRSSAASSNKDSALKIPRLEMNIGAYDDARQPLEAGERVEYHGVDTVESTAMHVARADERIAASSLTPEERLLARCDVRWSLLNPLAPSPYLSSHACWRYFAPLLLHRSLLPSLPSFLFERVEKKLLTMAELKDVVDAVGEEVRRVERGERRGYGEWRRVEEWKREEGKRREERRREKGKGEEW